MQEAKWKELLAKYEEDKKKDPDFAIPPDDGQLLKFSPKRVWQKGEVKWHVDAPVNLAGDKLLVPTSYLDKEKVGERALYAHATGRPLEAELTYSVGGATLPETWHRAGSSIGTTTRNSRARATSRVRPKTGEQVAEGSATGGVWLRRVRDGLAVCTATDGPCEQVADGEQAFYDAKTPSSRPRRSSGWCTPRTSGTVHAIDLKTGNGSGRSPGEGQRGHGLRRSHGPA
jgi:hypothetical protein